MQPPPRGCVLKQFSVFPVFSLSMAAASARLCVETGYFAAVDGIDNGSRLRAAVC